MIPTATEFINTNYHSEEQMLIEFAKLHVTAALEEAAKNAHTTEEPASYTRRHETITVIDKNSILRSYPLTNIK